MNDFDFEELDQAVNKLAAKTQAEHGDSSGAVSITPAFSTPKAGVKPSTPKEPTPPTTAPTVTPPHRSSRLPNTKPSSSRRAFMDIVPPSPRKSVQSGGTTVQPISKPDQTKPKIDEAPIAPEPTQEKSSDQQKTVSPPEAKPQPTPTSDEVAWPDPLDFQNFDGEELTSGKKNEPQNSEAITPFLAEAKVEKRPLGAYSNFKAAEPEKAEDQPKPPASPAPTTPDELTPESDGTFKEPPAPEEKAKSQKPEPKTAKEPQGEEQKETPEQPTTPDLHKTAMMSIPEQYRTEKKDIDTSTRPVFDTKEYHPPLAETALAEHRGSSMWVKLFVVLIVIAILAVAGYFVYLYVAQ